MQVFGGIAQRCWTAVLALLLALVGTLALTTSASADANCQSHCYSVARYSGQGYAGAWAQIRRNYLSIGTGYGMPGAHINSEFWFELGNGNYLEAGLRDGDDSNSSGSCGCVAYDAFWADHTGAPNGDTEYRHIIAHVAPNDNVFDTYKFSRSGATNVWDVYFNDTIISTSTVTGDWTGWFDQIGGEYVNSTCVQGAGWANNFDMYAMLEDTNSNWMQPAWNSQYMDSGCGFEGIHYFNGEWS
jgi:hypothetical protein